ncbi:MAG: J domain-containing protein [Deltaproteobacteria bacterium]|nr:J domain-containing protein [Deltaproteobacteria bacterium]
MHVLKLANCNPNPAFSVRPSTITTPLIKSASLIYLNLSKEDLYSAELSKIVKNAYRRQAKIYHPDLGGDAAAFRKINQAYEDLTKWAESPSFSRRKGFPDKWFYDGSANKWMQPVPAPQNSFCK